MTRAIHQLVHTLSYGDAISGEVLALQRVFRGMGCDSEIFAIHEHPKLKGVSHHYRALSADVEGEVILHYSLGSPLNDVYRKLSRASRCLIHHNITPARWFEGINPRIVTDINNGIREFPELCMLSDRLVADSRYNAGEIAALGCTAEIVPLPIDAKKWDVARNPGIYSLLSSTPGLHLVHVGRLAPNKCVEDIIKAFFFVRRAIDPQAHLWLVGIDIDTELYSFGLKRLVDHLLLRDVVHFTGCLADSEVRALYEAGSVYLCMSEHEGFCLPVLEAMHFGMPVIAYASTALPDTVGNAGVLVHEKRHEVIAELVGEVCRNNALRTQLVSAGRERVKELTFERFAERVQAVFSKEHTRPAARVAVPH